MATNVDSDAQVTELEADCKELKRMLEQATRANVQQELQRVLDMLEAELRRTRAKAATLEKAAHASASSAPAVSEAAPVAKSASPPATASAVKPAAAKPAPHVPVPVSVKSVGPWTEITTFALDLGGYDKPQVIVDIRLKGVENLPSENVTCDFTDQSLDLKVLGLDGQNHRFFKTNLDKDIVPRESNVRVKKNHVIVTLIKVKGDYGYDSWTDLVAKGRRKTAAAKKDSNPQDSIMDMMQNLYEDGDESMKSIIGEAMYKAKRGEKYEPKTDDLKMPKFDDKLDDI